jgi:hypothetical protein
MSQAEGSLAADSVSVCQTDVSCLLDLTSLSLPLVSHREEKLYPQRWQFGRRGRSHQRGFSPFGPLGIIARWDRCKSCFRDFDGTIWPIFKELLIKSDFDAFSEFLFTPPLLHRNRSELLPHQDLTRPRARKASRAIPNFSSSLGSVAIGRYPYPRFCKNSMRHRG